METREYDDYSSSSSSSDRGKKEIRIRSLSSMC